MVAVTGFRASLDSARVRINGIESMSMPGASDINGNSNRSRGFDFSVFASELFNSLEVRKTSEAAVEEGSLGATVDLRTGRPFDFKGRTVSFGVQESWNSVARKTRPRFNNDVMGRLDDFGGTVANAAPGSGAFHPRIPIWNAIRRRTRHRTFPGITACISISAAPSTNGPSSSTANASTTPSRARC